MKDPKFAFIFDMDGVLIDSEPYWRDAIIKVFADLNQQKTEEDCRKTMGVRIDELVRRWHAETPWSGPSTEVVSEQIVNYVIQCVRSRGSALPGALDLVARVKARFPIVGLATSSPTPLMNAILEKLKLQDAFDVIHSAESEPYGKPHPAVYLSTAKKLGVDPERCLAIEDSVNGVIAAKAAKMKCLAVPEKALQSDPRFAIADWKGNTLDEVTEQLLDRLSPG